MQSKQTNRKLLQQVLNGQDAEFLIRAVNNRNHSRTKQLHIRVGQLWKLPKLQGTTALLLDYDNCKSISIAALKHRLYKCGVCFVSAYTKRSPSGQGWHVLCYVAGRYNKWQVIALQSILESDPEREAQNFKRASQAIKQWKENWQVLFR